MTIHQAISSGVEHRGEEVGGELLFGDGPFDGGGRVRRGDVGHERANARGAFRGLRQASGGAADDEHLGALRREPPRRGAADPGAARGDEHGLGGCLFHGGESQTLTPVSRSSSPGHSKIDPYPYGLAPGLLAPPPAPEGDFPATGKEPL
ncbi:hypothetical protein GCM10009754_86320 [Amycolatopsis minnesotensis]|uniref:Uncharacterized protein n=1 Tax=Amycolatopsis minnesotensis TaxID=337894 RepID=A0ABP5EAR6_9PSEU